MRGRSTMNCGRFNNPLGPKIVWAPGMALARQMVNGEVPYFVAVLDTPCGVGPFVFFCSKIVIEDDKITIMFVGEGRPHNAPDDEQLWNFGMLYYELAESGEITTSNLEISETLSDKQPEFTNCPADIADVTGYAEAMEALKAYGTLEDKAMDIVEAVRPTD